MTHGRKSRVLVASMVLAVAGVAVLAWWDGEREWTASLQDFADEQGTLAQSVAVDLSARLLALRQGAMILARAAQAGLPVPADAYQGLYDVRLQPARAVESPLDGLSLSLPLGDGRQVEVTASVRQLLRGLGRIERRRALELFVRPPGTRTLYGPDGRRLSGPGAEHVLAVLEAGETVARLPGEEAAGLGLTPRTALAGLATAKVEGFGSVGVAVLASAERERDRERQARLRLLLSVSLAAGLVLGFGGLALREQRKSAQAREQKERDERLQREGRAATMMTLASGVAHEVSTPLGVIVGRAEQLLERAGQDERAARSLQIILAQCEDIRQVIRGFLGLARGGSPMLQSADPGAVLASAVALVEHRFKEANVHLRVRPSGALPAIRCDPRLLEHALVNLMLNACDACAATGGSVEVAARADDASVAFEVLDDGSGIAPDVAARATEPFFSTKPVEQGTGLGLAITSEIVKSHRGSLEVKPRAGGRGTAARVRVPQVSGAADA